MSKEQYVILALITLAFGWFMMASHDVYKIGERPASNSNSKKPKN